MNTTPSLKDTLLQKIRTHDVSMRPRIYFTLQLIALSLITVASIVTTVFLCNLIFFSLRVSSHVLLLGFGAHGIFVFFKLFPWGLLIIDIALVAGLLWLIRKFRFGYTTPMLYVLAAITVITIGAAATFDRTTRVNDRLLMRADEHRLPFPLGSAYKFTRSAPLPHHATCTCKIISIEGDRLTLEDTQRPSPITMVIRLPRDNPRATTTGLEVGDIVFVAAPQPFNATDTMPFGVKKLLVPKP